MPYDEQEGKVRAIPFRDVSNVGPAGSINSNVLDMARWVAVHTHGGKLGGKSITSTSMLAELHTPQMTMGRPSEKKEISAASYALGWMVDSYRMPATTNTRDMGCSQSSSVMAGS